MFNHAKGHYGEPGIIELAGQKYYSWRGAKGSVGLDLTNNSLAIMDSQLLIEYNTDVKKFGP